LAAAGIIAYANFSDEVNKFVNGVFTGGFPTVTEAATPTPTEIADGLVIPEGLAVEDKQVRESMRLMIREGNAFGLDVVEVKNYLATGETADLKTFEVAKDAEGKPAFVIVKGGNNGFDENGLVYIERTVDKMNKIDPTITRTIADKHNLRFLSEDINNEDFFKTHNWGATYGEYDSGGFVLINQSALIGDPELADAQIMGFLVTESRATYTTSFGSGALETTAPDRLSNNVGIDKGLYILNLSKEWFNNNKISKTEKSWLDAVGNGAVDYYSKN